MMKYVNYSQKEIGGNKYLMKKISKNILTFFITMIVILVIFNPINAQKINESKEIIQITDDKYNYDGHLRIYIVEPKSRYDRYDGKKYHNGFLDFAYNDQISVNYNETLSDSITWKGDISEDNVFVIVALFNPISKIGYAYPPNSKPFRAYYVDASAGAHPNETGENIRDNEITHTVFIEEGTASWCKNCPSMADALYNISKESKYPFYYTALTDDLNQKSEDRLDDLNIYAFPTTYIDGGKEVLIGGNPDINDFKSLIEDCAKSDVHEMDLSISVEWLGEGEIKIDYNIKNLEEKDYQLVKVKNILGGVKKVRTIVENIEKKDLTDVDWMINVKGGIFDKINHTTTGKIEDFPVGTKKIIHSKPSLFNIYGFGRIEIIIKVGSNVKTADGFIFGKLIFVKN